MNQNLRYQPPHSTMRAGRHGALRIFVVFAMLLSVMGAALLGGRPISVGAQDLAFSTAEAAPADTLIYATINADLQSEQLITGQALLEASGARELLDVLEINFDDMGEPGEMLSAAQGGEVGIAMSGSLGLADVAEALPAEDAGIATPDFGGDAEGAEPMVVIIIRGQDPDAAYEVAQGLVSDAADLAGETVTQSEYNGTTIESVIVTPVPSMHDDEESSDSVAVAQVGDFVLLAEFEEHLYSAIDAAIGETDNLTDVQSFQDVRAELEGDYLIFGYADGVRLGATLDESDDTATGSAAADADALQGYAGLRIWADESAPGIRFDTVTIAAEGADWEEGEIGFDTTLDGRVPGSTLLFASGNNFGESLIGSLLIAAVVDFAATMEMPGGLETPVGVSRVTEIIGDEGGELLLELFQGEYAVALAVPGMAALMDPNQIFLLVTSDVSNEMAASAFAGALDEVIQSSAGEGTTFDTVEVGGATVFQATNVESGLPIVFQYGVVDGQFVIGFGDSLTTYLGAIEDPLSENPQYVQTFEALSVPGQGGGRIYVDLLQISGLVQMFAGLFSGSAMGLEDAHPSCGDYADQAEAQEAYDADPFEMLDLDQDFDGEACEDFFGTSDLGTPEPTLDTLDLSGIVAYGQEHFEDGDVRGTRGVLLLDVE